MRHIARGLSEGVAHRKDATGLLFASVLSAAFSTGYRKRDQASISPIIVLSTGRRV